jgi:hypothetical protein
MVDFDTSLIHHFLELTIAHRIRHIPADAPQDHVAFKMAALEINHRANPPAQLPAIIVPTDPREKFTPSEPHLGHNHQGAEWFG